MAEPNAAVTAALSAAARATGVSAAYLSATAKRESAFDASAKAATSSASGLFQFIESTWVETLSRHAARLGLGDNVGAAAERVSAGAADQQEREALLELRFDPKAAALMAGALARDNADRLEAALGRAPSDGELYAAHVLGAGGAARLIAAAAADGGASAAELFPEAADSNRGLFFDGETPVSVGDLLAKLTSSAAKPGDAAPLAVDWSSPDPSPARQNWFWRAPAMRLTGTVLAALAMLDAPKRPEES